jgi:hypothetical protein
LPTQLGGVRIDCPVIKGYLRSYSNHWSIDRDARFRIWPASGPLIRPGTFQYPVKQRWGAAGRQGMKYEWSFDDGTKATGAKVKHVYAKPGRFRPTLKVTDVEGRVDYDFGKVTVADPDVPPGRRCYLHASYWPTKDIRAGDEVAFLVRSFRFQPPRGDEVWNFGDGSPAVRTQSDGAVNHRNKDGYAVTKHRFEKPGYYIVAVERKGDDGQWAVDKLDVRVEPAKTEPFCSSDGLGKLGIPVPPRVRIHSWFSVAR